MDSATGSNTGSTTAGEKSKIDSVPPRPLSDRNVSKAAEVTTPSKRRPKERRRSDGSPILARDPAKPAKTIYLIRHGQSQAQAAASKGLDRKADKSLQDCGMTRKGIAEASQIPYLLSEEELDSIQLVVSSPLRRALHTALLGFPDRNILVHYDLREIGSKVPENHPLPMSKVLGDRDLSSLLSERTALVDTESLQPPDWPRDFRPLVVQRDRVREALRWLYVEREEQTIAIVCHYHVIRNAVSGGQSLRPQNAVPIKCQLFSTGELVVVEI